MRPEYPQAWIMKDYGNFITVGTDDSDDTAWQLVDGAEFNALRQSILNGFIEIPSSGTGFIQKVVNETPVTSVYRHNDHQIRISFPAAPDLDLSATAEIKLQIPNGLVTVNGAAIVDAGAELYKAVGSTDPPFRPAIQWMRRPDCNFTPSQPGATTYKDSAGDATISMDADHWYVSCTVGSASSPPPTSLRIFAPEENALYFDLDGIGPDLDGPESDQRWGYISTGLYGRYMWPPGEGFYANSQSWRMIMTDDVYESLGVAAFSDRAYRKGTPTAGARWFTSDPDVITDPSGSA